MAPQGRTSVSVRAQNTETVFYMDNNEDETIILNGPIGDTTVRIEKGRAWVESSPCENQTCVATGVIFRAGQWSACLPNNILILMQGGSAGDEDIDALSW